MPLLTFPGGYGGMVHSDSDCVSLSICIQRQCLRQVRRESAAVAAHDAVLAYVKQRCPSVRDALDGADLEPDSWRSAGPIRPGIRATVRSGVFLVGNAAGEAHPAIAEGISMAMQSSWLLTRRLIASSGLSSSELKQTGAAYRADWKRAFAWRIRAAATVAHWAMRPAAVAAAFPLLRAYPAVLTATARTTGKISTPCSWSC